LFHWLKVNKIAAGLQTAPAGQVKMPVVFAFALDVPAVKAYNIILPVLQWKDDTPL